MKESLENARVVVLGCGSILHGDDVFGSLVVDALGRGPALPVDVECIDAGTGGPRLVNLLGARLRPPALIVIDTAMLGKPAGTVTVLRSHRVPGQVSGQTTHGMRLADELSAYPGPCYLVLCEPRHLSAGKSPSPQVYGAVADACDWVRSLLEEARA
ncbi:MAG: hydrogenase maturation protease [Candidatus Methanofastidiosa archaeon]|nr:hydrogenase maturation protease [Candidatus Methanofastidiosa archaeon]